MVAPKHDEVPAEEEYLLNDAFLSYSRKNDSVADKLMAVLSERGFRVARDIHDLRGGEDWSRRLKVLIEQSKNVIFLISEESLVSKYCCWELDYAVSLNKRLIPVLAGTVQPGDLPESLKVVHWIDARGDRMQAADEIETALRTDQDWTEIHTDLALRARAWFGKEGGLLRGRELKRFGKAVEDHAGKKPDATGEQMAFLSACRKAARRRVMVLFSTVAAVTVAFLVFGIIAWIQDREKDLLALKRQGDSALVQVENGDLATAVASLGYVALNGKGMGMDEYGEVGKFWTARFKPLDEVTQQVKTGEVLVWRGICYLRASADLWHELPPQPFRLAVIAEGKQVILMDASGVTLRSLPSFEILLRVPAERRLVPDFIYPLEGGNHYLVQGHHLDAGDEDESTFEPAKLTIIGPRPDGLVPHRPDENETGVPAWSDIVIGKSGTVAISHLTESGFTVRLAKEDRATKRFIIGGEEEGYENPSKHLRWEVDATSGKVLPNDPAGEVKGEDSGSPPSMEAGEHRFPQGVSEEAFWKMPGAVDDLPAELRRMARAEEAWTERFDQMISSVDFGWWGSGESPEGDWSARMREDGVARGVHEAADGSSYPWALVITGNHLGEMRVAKVRPDKRVEWCRGEGFTLTTSRQIFSPDRRWMAVATREGAEEPLRLLDVREGILKPISGWPSVHAYGMAFDADSRRFAALTANGELLIYSLEGEGAPDLRRRVPVSSRAVDVWWGEGVWDKIWELPLLFAGDMIVGADLDGRLFAIHSGNGEKVWNRPLPESQGPWDYELFASARGPYVALRNGEKFVLHHARTGTPLTEAVTPEELRQHWDDAYAAEENAFVGAEAYMTDQGDFCIVTNNGIFLRERPAGGLSARLIESLTGISSKDGRTLLEKLSLGR